MATPTVLAEKIRKEEYFEILDETIRTNPHRKAATAMVTVMNKHGINIDATAPLGRSSTAGPSDKKCALTKSLRHAQACNIKLNLTKEELQLLCCDLQNQSDHESQPQVAAQPRTRSGNGPIDKASMTGYLLTLIGEAQTIAKRIYETAVGLHVAEDYLRQPADLRILDFSPSGRIQIPNYNFNHASQLCLEWLHSTALKWLNGFRVENKKDKQFISAFENFTKAIKEYTDAVRYANQVFRVFLYSNDFGKECLKEYLGSLGHVLKNDIMMEMQSLRRAFDSIQYSFERLGWAASIAWMKYSGQTITVDMLNEKGIQADYSTFQHKFYEGPGKLACSTPPLDVFNAGGSTANAAILTLSNASAGQALLLQKARTADNNVISKRSGTGSANISKVESRDAIESLKPKGQLQTSSLSGLQEMSKVKKVKRKLKPAKPKAVHENPPPESSGIRRPASAYTSVTESDPKPADNLRSSGDAKEKIAPSKSQVQLPPRLRKQFGDVFGSHLVPDKGGRKKNTKKRVKAKRESTIVDTPESQDIVGTRTVTEEEKKKVLNSGKKVLLTPTPSDNSTNKV